MTLILVIGIWPRPEQLSTAWTTALNITGGVLLLLGVAASVAGEAVLPGDSGPGLTPARETEDR